jgi:putative transposase
VFVRGEDGQAFRPWLTLALDVGTRDVAGWTLARTPSSDTIIAAFLDGCRTYGVPACMYTDNGRDYSSLILAGGIERFRMTEFKRSRTEEEMDGLYRLLDVHAVFAKPGNAQAKIVERFFRTLQGDLLRALPGYVGNRPGTRPEDAHARIRAGEALSMAECREMLAAWIETYRRRAHSGQGMAGQSPLQAWNAWIQGGGQPRKASPATLALLLQKGRAVSVTRQGVRVERRSYWSRDLVAATNIGDTVVVRYDPEEMSGVFVFDLQGRFLCEAARIERTAYFDEDAPEVGARRQKAVREVYAAAVAEAAAAAKQIDADERALGVRTVACERAEAAVVRPLATAMDKDARALVARGETRALDVKAERTRRRKAEAEARERVLRAAERFAPTEPAETEDPMARLVRAMEA